MLNPAVGLCRLKVEKERWAETSHISPALHLSIPPAGAVVVTPRQLLGQGINPLIPFRLKGNMLRSGRGSVIGWSECPSAAAGRTTEP